MGVSVDHRTFVIERQLPAARPMPSASGPITNSSGAGTLPLSAFRGVGGTAVAALPGAFIGDTRILDVKE